MSSRVERREYITGPALFAVCFLTAFPAAAQVVASGQQLTVTSTNAVATFQGPDLVGFTNSVTGESYLRSAPSSPLMNLEIQGVPSQNLEVSSWTTSIQSGITIASLTMQDTVRSVTITVKVDPSSQEIVINLSGQATQTGVSAAYWAIAGLDLGSGHLIVPASTGIVIDQKHEQVGNTLVYPYDWQAQMMVYEAAAGSLVVYSTDSQALFKQLRIASHLNSTIDLSIATQPNGPFPNDTSVPPLEWRLKAFAGDWRAAAAVYRNWLAANRPPVSNANHAWVNNIRTVVQLGTRDPAVLNTLATEVTPSETLLYIPDWRQSPYDNNYPDYTPASDVASFVALAHSLGFKVMLHTDLIGVTPSNPDFASVQQWQVKDPSTLQLIGWEWSSPPSTPNRFAWINPAAPAYRSLFIARVGAAVAAVQPDALHLDVSSPSFNDGNGLINGMSYAQGSVQLHRDLVAAFPNIALGGEGMNDLIYPYNSFAQAWAAGTATGYNTTFLGHPIVNFLWNSQTTGPQVLYYGHLGQPAASDPAFIDSLSPIEREAIFPALAVNSATDLDLTNPDNARLNRWMTSWQTNAFQPDWSGTWGGVLIPYKGVSNATASLTDSGTIISLTSGASPIYRRVHDTNQVNTTNFIPNWPAFDSANLYGLDPAQQYWLDAVARPSPTHAASLPAGVELGPDTAVFSAFAFFQLAPTPAYDFFGNLWAASIGVTVNGVDGPLGFGATAEILSTTAGGVTRQGIFMQPPYQQGRAGGEAFVEWAVPITPSATFSFSVGVADNAGSCTDGVTFRVVVNGAEQWRQNVLHQGWVDGSVDLSAYAGQTARLRIVTNPGPANNPNCDWASFSNLALTEPAGSASVPLILAPGATFSGFSGSGTYSSITNTVTGVSVPGEFVVFTAPGSAVGEGTTLASLPFTTWLGADGRLAAPGTIFGSGSIGNPPSGGVTKQNAIFGHPPANGRTILNWTLALPSSGNLQLGWSAGIQDGSLTSTGVQFSVRINGLTYWTDFQAGPAGWTPGSLDLSSWRGQNILVQLVTDSVGNNDYDWGWWADLKLASGDLSPPAAPVLTAPANMATGVSTSPVLTWNAAAGANSYDVYFGKSPTPPLIANVSTANFTPGALIPGTYYWRIVSRSATGIASSSTLLFTTTGTTHFSVTAPAPAIAGLPVQFTVTALDALNHTVTTYSDVVHFTSSDGLAALPADSALTNGVGTFRASLVTLGAQTITATDTFISSISGASASIVVSAPSGLRFVPVTPCRLVDTRNTNAPFITGGTSRNFTIPGNCGIPTTAQAFSLNAAVVPHGALGYITLWPTGQTQPTVATLNSLDGRIKSNAAIVPAGIGGAVSVFAANDTDVILDINGYFVPASTTGSLAFYPVTPCRLVDTRHATLLNGPFPGGTSRTLPILASACNIPASAQAYSLNFTVVAPGQVGYITAYPTGVAQPVVATLNALPPLPLSVTPVIVANAAVVPAGTNGSIDVFAANATDLVVDINGYFAPGTGGLSLYNLPPCRVLDTRKPTGSPPFTGAIDVNVLGAGCGGTPQAQGYVFNATVAPPSALGYLTMWPQGTTQPTVATLNALDGTITNNMAIVPTNNTEFSAFASNSTHLIVDMFGYFAP